MRRATTCLALLALATAAVLGAHRGARGQSRPPAAATDVPRLPSPVVYPPQRIALRMDHALPAHRELRCVRCHRGAGVSERAEDLLIPPEDSCQPCHAAALDRDAPDRETRCATCHQGFGERGDQLVPASDFPTARLRFSHRQHVEDGMRCLTCHEGVGRAGLATREHLPTMRQCFECHGPPGFAA